MNLDKITPQDRSRGRKIDRLLRNMLSRTPRQERQPRTAQDERLDPSQAEFHEASVQLFVAREAALRAAGLGNVLAASPQLNNFRETNVRKADQNLARKLTRQQYLNYTDSLEGTLRLLVSKNQATDLDRSIAQGELDAKLFSNYKAAPVMDETGNMVEVGYDPINLPTVSLFFS